MNRKLILLPLLVGLSACDGKRNFEPEKPVEKSEIHNLLQDSFLYSEAEILIEAKRRLLAKEALGAAEAERCWQREERRPAIRDVCLLLWAISNTASQPLETALQAFSESNPLPGVAAVLQEKSIKTWSYTSLLRLLEALQSFPTWLRARAVLHWLPGKTIGPVDAEQITSRLTGASTPADFSTLWQVLERLRPGAKELLLRDHCSANATGQTRLRCWRFLSALPFSPEAKLFQPPTEDEDWTFFRRNMPHRARILETR